MNLKCVVGLHDWTKDCAKCAKCGKTRSDEEHDWSKDCAKCAKCEKTRLEEAHDWSKDCEKCAKCGARLWSVHSSARWNGKKCIFCEERCEKGHYWEFAKDEKVDVCKRCGQRRPHEHVDDFSSVGCANRIQFRGGEQYVCCFRCGAQMKLRDLSYL